MQDWNGIWYKENRKKYLCLLQHNSLLCLMSIYLMKNIYLLKKNNTI